MKKTITLIVLAVCTCLMSYAQSESEARSSKNYYGVGAAANQEAAVEKAKTDLAGKIRPDMMKDAQFRKADGATCRKIADQGKVFLSKKGSTITAIVYIPKDELKRAYAEAVMFDALPDDGLDESGNPRDPSAPAPAPAVNKTITELPVAEQPVQVVVVTENKPATTTQPVVVPQQTAPVTQPTTTTTQPAAQPVVVTPPPAQQPVQGTPAKTGNKLLDEILDAHNLFELNDFFTKGKNTGALAYGRLNTMTAPENSYLLLYQPDGTIVAVYDKGSATRKNLRTGTTENYANMFDNVKIIWFQLYQ